MNTVNMNTVNITIPSCKGITPKIYKRTFHNFKGTSFHLYEGSAVIELPEAYLVAMSNCGYFWYVSKDGHIKQKMHTFRADIMSAFGRVHITPNYEPTKTQKDKAKERRFVNEYKAEQAAEQAERQAVEQLYSSINPGYIHAPSTKGALYASKRTNKRSTIKYMVTERVCENTHDPLVTNYTSVYPCHEVNVTKRGTIMYRNGKK